MNTVTVSSHTPRATRLPSVIIKAAMAVSGMGLAVWLTLHMAGNLLWLLGPNLMDTYGATLHGSGVLWPVRLLLIGGLAVHIVGAVLTTQRAHAARPVRYHKLQPSASSVASRSMRWTGMILFAFLGYHVASVYGVGHEHVSGAFHHNLSTLLMQPWDALLLAAAAGLMSMHLAHGLGSAFLSLGAVTPKHEPLLRRGLRIWGYVVTVGFLLPPLVAWLSWAAQRV